MPEYEHIAVSVIIDIVTLEAIPYPLICNP